MLSRWLRRLDRGLPIALKLVLPLAAICSFAVVAYMLVAVPVIRTQLEQAYSAQDRELAMIVQAEYTRDGTDRAALTAFVRDVDALDASVIRIRIYRMVSGSPLLWASSASAELSSFPPLLSDLAPLTTGATTQAMEVIDGTSALETVAPLRSTGGVIDATVGIYTSLATLEAAVNDLSAVPLLTAAITAAAVLLAAALVVYAIVLRPIQRLHHAALRIAAGDLTVRLAEGDVPTARDEIMRVARAFDQMTRMVAEQHTLVEHLAMTDGLTGLFNRRSFDQRVEVEAGRTARLRYPLVVSVVDLDGFKGLNDAHGHQAGDDALRRVAGALVAAVRSTDIVARYGGDEFALIQPGCDPAAAVVVAGRIRRGIEQLGIVTDVRTGRLLSASVGSAAQRPGESADAVVASADEALYRAKARGGGIEMSAETGMVEAR